MRMIAVEGIIFERIQYNSHRFSVLTSRFIWNARHVVNILAAAALQQFDFRSSWSVMESVPDRQRVFQLACGRTGSGFDFGAVGNI